MTDSEKLQDLKTKIKALEQNKPVLSDTAEIKTINKQINALQEEYGYLRKEIQYRRSYEQSKERMYTMCWGMIESGCASRYEKEQFLQDRIKIQNIIS